MGIETTHPQWGAWQNTWRKMWHCHAGEDAVKAERVRYLPPTQGMRLDGMMEGQPGYEAYEAYLLRSVFPEYVAEAVEAYLGMMHQKAATIKLPTVMEPLRNNATANGEPLTALLRNLNMQQLVGGRVGLLADLPLTPDPAHTLPYIAMYSGVSIRNWDDGTEIGGQTRMNLVVLDESTNVRDGFEWRFQNRYRVLILGNPSEDETQGTYLNGLYTEDTGFQYSPDMMVSPSYMGRTLTTIPFVIANTRDLSSNVSKPPLLSLANRCMAIYRGEADYRQNLFMQGQDTLIIKGGTGQEGDTVRTGSGSTIKLDENGDAKYIGVNSQGLPEQRLALQNDRQEAEARAGQLSSQSDSQVESSDALETRLAAQTSTLNQIALTGAIALQRILQDIALWMGANPEEVEVSPNLDFASVTMEGQDLNYWMQARKGGAPISIQSIHGMLADRGATKLDFDTEMKLVEQENKDYPALAPEPVVTPTAPTPPTPAGTKPSDNPQPKK